MKKSRMLIDLPVISIQEGAEIAAIKDLIINTQEKDIEFLVIQKNNQSDEPLYAIPYNEVIGVGEYAVTIDNVVSITNLESIDLVKGYLNKRSEIIDEKIVTRRGEFIGEVLEYTLDTINGQLESIIFKSTYQGEIELSIDYVITIGEKLIIVEDDAINLMSERHAKVRKETKNLEPKYKPFSIEDPMKESVKKITGDTRINTSEAVDPASDHKSKNMDEKEEDEQEKTTSQTVSISRQTEENSSQAIPTDDRTNARQEEDSSIEYFELYENTDYPEKQDDEQHSDPINTPKEEPYYTQVPPASNEVIIRSFEEDLEMNGTNTSDHGQVENKPNLQIEVPDEQKQDTLSKRENQFEQKQEVSTEDKEEDSTDETKVRLDPVNEFIRYQRNALIGKTLTRDILGKQGEVIVPKGTLIDADTFYTYKNIGKMQLMEMSIYSE